MYKELKKSLKEAGVLRTKDQKKHFKKLYKYMKKGGFIKSARGDIAYYANDKKEFMIKIMHVKEATKLDFKYIATFEKDKKFTNEGLTMLFKKDQVLFYEPNNSKVKVQTYLEKDIMKPGLELKCEVIESVIDEDIGQSYIYEESNLYFCSEEILECGNEEDVHRVDSKVQKLAESYPDLRIHTFYEEDSDHYNLDILILSRNEELESEFKEALLTI